MVVSCEEVWREISNYLEGEVGPGLRAAMEEHLRGCKHCTAVLDGTRNVIQLYGDERMVEVPLGFSHRLHRRLEENMPANNTRRTFFGWMVAAAAGVLVAGGLAAARSPGFRYRLHRRLEENMPANNTRRTFFGWMVAAAAGVLVAGGLAAARSSGFTPELRSEHAQPGRGVPPEMMVLVTADGKTFHRAGCSFIHDKDKQHLRTVEAREAQREGYVPCVRCMKQYLSARHMEQPASAEANTQRS